MSEATVAMQRPSFCFSPSPPTRGRGSGRGGMGSTRLGGFELLIFRRALQGDGRGMAGRDRLRHLVEVAGADEALVLDGLVAGEALVLELPLLEPRVGGHAA